ncbi:MAG: hypothetical protein AAFX00_05120 [Pseudomonadota bacterium]
MRLQVLTLCLCFSSTLVLAVDVGQDAIDGCIDQLRAVGGPDGQSGTVLSTEYSEANSLVMLQDRGETVWRCLVSNDGQVAELSVAQAADDGQGAMAGAGQNAVVSGTQRVQFAAGTSGAAMSGTLNPNTSVSYVLGAADGQFMRVDLGSLGGALDYRIFNPDGSLLLDLISSDTPYQGQLWQSGDHVVEVVNAGAQPVSFDIGIGIDATNPSSESGQPAVGSSADLTAFEGARAGQAEMGVQNLGFELVRSEGLTSFWFNRDTGTCARITTSDGRYSDVTMLPAEDC